MKEMEIEIMPWEENTGKTSFVTPMSQPQKNKPPIHSRRMRKYNDYINNLNINTLKDISFQHNPSKYNALFNQDKDNFIPIKATNNSSAYLYKKPTVKASNFSYIDDAPQQVTPRRILSQNRSRTITISEPRRKKTSPSKLESASELIVMADPNYRGHTFQKMLKIKQKLRERSKKNSQRRELERQIILHRAKSKEIQSERTPSTKNWKQKLKVHNFYRSGRTIKAEMWVKGGSIYK